MWEPLKDVDRNVQSYRLKVPGGWIVRTIIRYDTSEGASCAAEQTFVSDPNHEWTLEKPVD